MIHGSIFPTSLRWNEIPLVFTFFVVGIPVILIGIWFLVKFLVSQKIVSNNSSQIILLALWTLTAVLFAIIFVEI